MKKFILMSVLYAVILVPSLAAKDPNPVRGVKRAMALMVAFNFFYAFLVLVVWMQLED